MAVEAQRGCGYRKIGGIYLVGAQLERGCGKLPILLHDCPVCGEGIKPSRGWTWIEPAGLLAGGLNPCGYAYPAVVSFFRRSPSRSMDECATCPLGMPDGPLVGRHGLIWIGGAHYPTPEHFRHEAVTMGVCRRIKAVPRGFELGKTWVLLAHRKNNAGEHFPHVFSVFCPRRIEQIIPDTMPDEEREKLIQRGITPVEVPHDDPDHQ